MISARAGIAALYLLAAGVAVVVAVSIWRRRWAPGAVPLALMMAAAGWWALSDAVELQMTSIASRRLVSQIQYFGVLPIAPLFFHAAVGLARRERWLTRGVLAAVWLPAIASLVVVWTSAWHDWLWTAIESPSGGSPFAVYHYGPWFWGMTAHLYLVLAAGTAILVGAARRVAAGFRAPFWAVLCAAALVWVGNLAYDLKLGPWPGLNWLSLSVVLSGTMLGWAVSTGALLDLLPRAREAVVERLSDGFVVIARGGEVVWQNDSARRLLGSTGLRVVLERVSGRDGTAPEDAGRIEIEEAGERRWLDIRADPVLDRWGEKGGEVLVLRDVSDRTRLELDRERLVEELQDALHEVRTLEGMLPICASCKKIRDDQGYWRRVEDYFSHRSALRFSHGICPDCAERLYADVSEPPPDERDRATGPREDPPT